MRTNWAKVGAAVKQRRSELKISQRRLAHLADISPTTVANLEKGQAVNTITAVSIAGALSWPPDAIDLLADGTTADELPDVKRHGHRSVEDRLSSLEERFDRVEAAIERLENADQPA